MAHAWLALGANIGDPLAQLEDAIARLDAHPAIKVKARSSIIVTAPWGKTDQNDFHNMALAVETDSTPQELLEACLGVELAMGRERLEHWGPRLIDIDVIAYEREIVDTDTLKLPHPYAHERDFVLDPLRESAPDVAAWIVGRMDTI
jgi:2-amino-4-hydroxy-6-hydroxymethyldihydropteridine diphosphokinase